MIIITMIVMACRRIAMHDHIVIHLLVYMHIHITMVAMITMITMIVARVVPTAAIDVVVMPVAIQIKPRADREADAKGNGVAKVVGPSLHINNLRLIHRHINHLRVGRINIDNPLFHHDPLLLRRRQVTRGLSLQSAILNRSHHIFLLIEERCTKVLRPRKVLIHHRQHTGIIRQRLHTGIPALLRDAIAQCGIVRVGFDEARGLHNVERESRTGKNLCNQRIRIERDGRDHFLELGCSELVHLLCRGRCGLLLLDDRLSGGGWNNSWNISRRGGHHQRQTLIRPGPIGVSHARSQKRRREQAGHGGHDGHGRQRKPT